ncbi:hypothetical protein [Candidatus Nitrosotenuis cloacae]|uniref:hypothetical protein n=1 Tax=Candidatus Nitrosotenuis cloacae TaxID=1603555 RepID=UPI002282F9CE|nr:hypothetical protein [Candidatus Nitrosotenuis cloacae]
MENLEQSTSNNCLILIDSSISFNELKSFLNTSCKIITFDYQSHILLKQNNIVHEISDEFIDDADGVQQTCYLLSRWSNDKLVSENLCYDGLNLGNLIQEEFRHFLIPIVKKFFELTKIYEKFKSSEFFAAPALYELLTCFSTQVKKIGISQSKTEFLNDTVLFKLTPSLTFRLSSDVYNSFKKIYDDILSVLFKPRINDSNILLVEADPLKLKHLLQILHQNNLKPVFLNRRRPVIWNLSSFLLIISSKSKFVSYHHIHKNDLYQRIMFDKKIISDKLNHLFENDSFFSKFFTVNDKSLWQFVKPRLYVLCKKQLIKSIEEIRITEILFDKYGFSHVLVLSEIGFNEQITLHVAKKKSVTSVLLQHGVYEDGTNSFTYNDNSGVIPNISDKISVWGEIMKNYLLSNGISLQKILLTGSIMHDDLFFRNDLKQNNFILFAVTPPSQNHVSELSVDLREKFDLSIKLIIDAVSKMNKNLVIKFHPSVTEKEILRIRNSYPYDFVKITNQNITSLIEKCEIFLVTDFSTTILDAAILKKPIVLIQIMNFSKNSSFFQSLLTIEKTDVEKILKSIIEDSKFKNSVIAKGNVFLSNYLVNGGKSSKILVDYLTSMRTVSINNH